MPLNTDRDQAIAALSLANEIRSRRSQLKADLKAGRILLADTLLSEAEWLWTMKVRDLLLATPGIGPNKARRALRRCQLSESARLGGVSKQTRVKLIAYLMKRYPAVYVAAESLENAA